MAVITKAEADRERRDALRTIQEEGARCALLYDGGVVDAETGTKTSSPRSVSLFALLGSYRLDLVGQGTVAHGDTQVTVADLSLTGLSLDPLLSVVDESAPTGFWLYLGGDPQRFPAATDPPAAGVRRLAVVRLEETVYVAGYPVLRVFQCRG